MINVLVLSTPRSGSSALISNIDGCGEAIFGELLLTTSPSKLRSKLLSNLNPFEVLKCCDYVPSNIPGVAAVRNTSGDMVFLQRFVGFKIMAYHALKNITFFIRCVKCSHVIVVLKPLSIRRQIISLAKIRAGNHAHYYVKKLSNDIGIKPSLGHIFVSFFVIFINNSLLFLNIAILKLFLHKKVVVGSQRDLKKLTDKILGLV